MQFSQDKLALFQYFTAFLTDPNREIMRIQGGAGCGKTTVIEEFVKKFLALNKLLTIIDPETQTLTSANVFLAATTNKAAAVIKEEVSSKLEPVHGSINTTTIYRLLNLKLYQDFKTGKEKIQKNNRGNDYVFPKGSLIIIDECSYVDHLLWWHIKNQLLKQNLKIVLLADENQGTPVNAAYSPVFDLNEVPDVFTLTERHRYPVDSAIYRNSLMFEGLLANPNTPSQLEFDSTFELVSRTDAWDLVQDHFVTDPKDSKLLTYRNNTALEHNYAISEAIYGNREFHVGQELICNNHYVIGQKALFNEQRVFVKSIGSTFNHSSGLPVRNIELKGIGFIQVPINPPDFFNTLKKFAAEKRWKEYFSLKESVIDLRHSWASTVHKSQGSSYDFTLIDYDDLETISDMDTFFRLMNVAITRSRQKVFLIKSD